MNQEQVSVRVLRHLQLEGQLMEQLESLCEGFSNIVEKISAQPVADPALESSDEALSALADKVNQVQESRKKISSIINATSQNSSPITIRQYIDDSPKNIRDQLNSLRVSLVARMREIQSRFVADSAVAFYSFDFYRKIINGLVDCIEEEKHYTETGKQISHESGKLLKKAC